MPWDPESGMWSPDVYRQPFGAMSAAMALYNSRRAKSISDQLMQGREAALAEQQQKTAEEAERFGWDKSGREAMMGLPDTASDQDMIRTYVRSGGDLARALPWMRADRAAESRFDVADLKTLSQELQQARKNGATADQLDSIVRGHRKADGSGYSEEQIASLKSFPGMFPQVTANIGKTEAQGDVAQATATAIPQRTAETERHDKASEEIARQRTAAVAKLRAGGVLTATEERGFRNTLAGLDAKIAAIAGKQHQRDPLTYSFVKLSDDEKVTLQSLKDQKEQIEGILEANEKRKAGASGGGAEPEESTEPGEDPTDPLGMFAQ